MCAASQETEDEQASGDQDPMQIEVIDSAQRTSLLRCMSVHVCGSSVTLDAVLVGSHPAKGAVPAAADVEPCDAENEQRIVPALLPSK